MGGYLKRLLCYSNSFLKFSSSLSSPHLVQLSLASGASPVQSKNANFFHCRPDNHQLLSGALSLPFHTLCVFPPPQKLFPNLLSLQNLSVRRKYAKRVKR